MRKMHIMLLFVLVAHFAMGQTRAEKKERQFAKVKELVTSGNFVFVADRAIGRAGTSISLGGNPNYLKVMGDSTVALMPFFGERFNASSRGEPGAIIFGTQIEDKILEHNEKKGRTTYKFSARNEYDRFGLILEISRSGWANLLIRSIDRSTIIYYGQVMALDKEKVSP